MALLWLNALAGLSGNALMKTSLFEVVMLGLILIVAVVAAGVSQRPTAHDLAAAAAGTSASAVERPQAR